MNWYATISDPVTGAYSVLSWTTEDNIRNSEAQRVELTKQLLENAIRSLEDHIQRNQPWADNAALRELERQGVLERVPGNPTIEFPIEYRRNPDINPIVEETAEDE